MKNKIGVFDSGVGGLTILSELYKKYPNESYIYIGDNKNSPYGDKTSLELFNYGKRIIDYFIENGVNIVVIGCNTTCSTVFDKLSKLYKDITIIGVIDATINKFLDTNKSNVLVIGTNATIKSNIYENKIKEKNISIRVHSLATPKLVPLIENNLDVDLVINEYLEPYKDIDSIILGCTHYKLIENSIRKDIEIINSSDGVVLELSKYFSNENEPNIKIYTTGDVNQFNRLCNKIMNINGEYLNL